MKKPKTEQVKDYLLSAKLDDFGSVQEIINDFCRVSKETITYSQFHQIYKQFVANPSAFKQAAEMQNSMGLGNTAPEVDEEIEIVRMKDVKIDKQLFVPLNHRAEPKPVWAGAGGAVRHRRKKAEGRMQNAECSLVFIESVQSAECGIRSGG